MFTTIEQEQILAEYMNAYDIECLSFCKYCKLDGDCWKQEKASDIIAMVEEKCSIGG